MASADTSSSDKEQVLPTINADQAHALLSSGHGYIDVIGCERTLTKAMHPVLVVFPTTCPSHLKEKNPQFEEVVATLFGKDDVFIVGCNTGNRSRFTTTDLLNAGFKNARNLQGGYRSFLQSASQQAAQQQ